VSDRAGLRLNIFTPNLEPWLIPNGNLQSLPPDTAPSPYCMSRDRTMNTNDERSLLLGGILMPVCRGGFHNYRFFCTQMRLNPPLCNGALGKGRTSVRPYMFMRGKLFEPYHVLARSNATPKHQRIGPPLNDFSITSGVKGFLPALRASIQPCRCFFHSSQSVDFINA